MAPADETDGTARGGWPPEPPAESESDDERAAIREAATAVGHALRPSLLEAIHAATVTWPSADRLGDVTALLATTMERALHQDRTVPFWSATGPQLTVALVTVVRDLDEPTASHLIGAALHAHILGRADTAADAVLRLAERAACWRAGTREASHGSG